MLVVAFDYPLLLYLRPVDDDDENGMDISQFVRSPEQSIKEFPGVR